MNDPAAPYRHAPIVEGVIDFHLAEKLGDRDLQRIRDKLKKTYPSVGEERQVDVSVEVSGIKTKDVFSGYKMTSANGVDVFLLREKSLTNSRLAPYLGWEPLFETTSNNFQTISKLVGILRPTRIGVRFINRIDLHTKIMTGRDIKDFIKIGIEIPEGLASSISGFDANVEFMDSETNTKVRVRCATAVPLLIEHISIMFDIDVIVDQDIPMRQNLLWERVASMRDVKNRVFETCITDELRRVIQ